MGKEKNLFEFSNLFYICRPGNGKVCAGVVKLVDTPDLGSGAVRCGGSSPSTRTKKKTLRNSKGFFIYFFSKSRISISNS